GRTVILDPAPAQPIPDALLRRADILTPNLQEAYTLAGSGEDASFDVGARSGTRQPLSGQQEDRRGAAGDENDSAPRTSNSQLLTPEAAAARLLIRGAPCAMVTLGREGVLVATAA